MEISQDTRYPAVSHGFYGSPKSRRMLREMLRLMLTVRCQSYCEAGANRAVSRKKLASRVALLACRGGVRTFAAPVAGGHRWPAY